MKKSFRPLSLAVAAGTVTAATGSAWAPQFSTDLETYNASPTGVLLTTGNPTTGGDQGGWYCPATATLDHSVYTAVGNNPPWITGTPPYTSNGPIPINPQGGAKFGAGHSAGGVVARAQHDYSLAAGNDWFFQFDLLARGYDGPTPVAQADNIYSYSFSMQPNGAIMFFQDLGTWVAGSGGTQYNIQFLHANANDPLTQVQEIIPNGAFANVPVNHWMGHQYWVHFNDTTHVHLITGIRLQDLTAGTPPTTIDVTGFSPQWCLVQQGGATAPRPSGCRFFAGGNNNSVAWDNLVIAQGTAPVTNGACCLTNGNCQNAQTFNQCTALSGAYQGDGVLCAANVSCPQPGSCCFADGHCENLNVTPCATAGGIYHSEPNCTFSCPLPGGCCLADGTCSILQLDACNARTGVYRGNASTCAAACPQPYTEVNPVTPHETRALAQIVTGSGPLPGIVGQLATGVDEADVYDIQICNPSVFKASTVTWTSGAQTQAGPQVDTMLWLFKDTGVGVEANDDNPVLESAISNAHVTAPGRYYIAVSGFEREPRGATTNGFIWGAGPSTVGIDAVPAGPAAAEPFGSWATTAGDSTTTPGVADSGFYTIALLGVCRVDHPCYANCDSSTNNPCLNVNDFGCFLNAFAAGQTYANCDNSTSVPTLNVNDFGCFLNKFAAGCSAC